MTRAQSPLLGQMVFVVGVRRSGTNWLQRLLCLHDSAVAVPSETHLFWDAVPALEARIQHGLVSSPKTGTTYMSRDAFLDATRDFCDAVFGGLRDRLAPHATRVVERTPWHAQRLDLIDEVYPDAAVVHILRDPRDVAASLVTQEWGPTTLADAAREWRDTVLAARAGHGKCYREVRQEDLRADPEAGICELLDWIGLDVDDRLRERIRGEGGRPVNTVRGADAVRSGPRWRSLAPAQIAEIEDAVGDLMAEVGYDLASRPAEGTSGMRERLLRGRGWRVSRGSRPDEGGAAEAPAEQPGGSLWMERGQALVDRFVGALGADDADSWRQLLDDDVTICVNGVDLHGEDGVQRLLAALPPRRELRQTRGDVHGGFPSFTVVLQYDDPGLRQVFETFVLTPGSGRLSRVVYYGHGIDLSPPS